MESQDGISVRPMRLKVLYTFDDASKTNCLARWPHLLEIQTAALDEKTLIGVIELKTCIQAIVSASPELVAKLGQDYTVYAYDYSEYETPLVGQGMLSWVLASSSPTPEAPAHQSQTMVTGRVCKNVLGLFSKGAQETLEVKLRLVPVPTVMQREYLDSIQKYRDLSNNIPHEFDAQTWTNFLRQNPALMSPSMTEPDRTASPMDHTGIERFHRLLSEGSTPREFPALSAHGSYRSASPASVSTPAPYMSQSGEQAQLGQAPRPQSHDRAQNAIRPSSSASMHDSDLPTQGRYASRRGSMQSGYGSGEESTDAQPRKRAKLYRATGPGKSDMNIERQPSSLRVAASTAASVRIHRPTPVNPSLAAVAASQGPHEEPVRPPTPISHAQDLPRRERPPPSLLRETSSAQNNAQYMSPYSASDDQLHGDLHGHSPEESRYQGLFEPSFSMPSSPPVLDCGLPNRSSPVLPPMTTDSGFMSGGVEEIMDEDIGTPLEDCTRSISHHMVGDKGTTRPAVHANSPVGGPANREPQGECAPEQPAAKGIAPAPVRAPASNAGSRPSSRASFRPTPKPLAPAPMSQSELEQIISSIPASDPVMPTQAHSSQAWGPMSDFSAAETPAPQPVPDDSKSRSGAGARRLKQVRDRLDKCIQNGQVPPYCENCGAIETPTWRRAWSKEFEGDEDYANELTKDRTMLFWRAVERDDDDKIIKFKVYKKTLADEDNDWVQILLCNPCGLWFQKFKSMRPEHKWNKGVANKKKRPSRSRKGGPLSINGTATRSRSRAESKVDGSSPGASDTSSPAADDGTTPADHDHQHDHQTGRENDDDVQDPPSKKRRANSAEPSRSSEKSRWENEDPMEALRRAIQSSPARNMENRKSAAAGEAILNSPRRSPRIATRGSDKGEDKENASGDLDNLFEGSPSFDCDLPASPTPKRRQPRTSVPGEKRLSLTGSPSSRRRMANMESPTKLTAQRLQRIQSSPGTPRQRTPKPLRQQTSEMGPLPADTFPSDTFGGMDNVMVDIFSEDAASAVHSDSLFVFEPSRCASSSNWPEWLPSDYVSPNGSEDDQGAGDESRDLINAILADPEVQKQNLNNPSFDLFNFTDSSILDSGFFGSDALNNDLMADKPEASKESDQTNTNA
ncbi:hypothetical protein BDW42DRAFT_178207 [Aspergillus taichungensis]|uniref:Ams2/SPT21 N-terminal domain-containing protein n=1 Tax=Aspergillus taichungensis TaxID=482145 RepID=A0A2J5HI37_9EURO|nr:hypothetical protein BDW42DRAFT_178207 [Aspergillus taichungensis]